MMTWLYNLWALFGVELMEAHPGTLLYVVDGDTIYMALDSGPEVKVRLSGIDAPEISGRCLKEQMLALQAKSHLQNLLPRGAKILIFPQGLLAWEYDKYGRLISSVKNHQGIDVAASLVRAELARKWSKRRPKPNWCGGV